MIPWRALPELVNADPEFRLAARAWTAQLRIDMDDGSQRLRFEDGHLAAVDACDATASCDLFIGAPDETWTEMLRETPRPFYQDLTGAQIHHGVRLPEDQLSYAAYYPALRRLVQLLGAAHRGS